MVVTDKFISIDPIGVTRSEKHICDECRYECDQGSWDPQEWLYSFNGQQLCWHCLQYQADFSKV